MLPKRPLGALSYSSLHTPVDGSFSKMCSSAPRSFCRRRGGGANTPVTRGGSKKRHGCWLIGSEGADLVLVEHVVGLVDDLLHVDDGADAGDVHIGQHGEDQDGLHQQLSVLRLRDSVQHGLHVDGELYLPRGHLKGKCLVVNKNKCQGFEDLNQKTE